MQNILTITNKELKSFFISPVAYIIIVVFLAITGWFFTSTLFVGGFVTMRGVMDIIPFIFLFFIPAISMRTLSEEKKSGTIELLMTKPITDMEIILGKFFSVLGLAIITLIPTVVYVVMLTFLGPVDVGTIFSAYLGLILMSALYISIGIFSSSLTENQVVAFIISFIFVFALFMLNKVLIFLPASLANILEYIGTDFHFSSIARGVIDSRDIIYYVSGVSIFLLLTKLSLERRKW